MISTRGFFVCRSGAGQPAVSTDLRWGDLKTHAPTTLREDDLILPDLLGTLQDRTELTRRTLSAVLRGSDRLSDFKTNPQAFIEMVGTAINTRKIRR